MRDSSPLPGTAIAAARGQQAEDQVVALANIVTAILAARRGEAMRRVDELPPDDARQVLSHARRALAERDPIKVGVAHHRGVRALWQAVEEVVYDGTYKLTPRERDAYRLVFHRALTAYQAFLEGHLGEPKADELAAASAGREASAS